MNRNEGNIFFHKIETNPDVKAGSKHFLGTPLEQFSAFSNSFVNMRRCSYRETYRRSDNKLCNQFDDKVKEI